MTTIRKIVTSKIDGNSANNTTLDEIRPFGETAFYVDTDGPTNKLVLSIHDGARTHLKSKVVGPGVLYGSNADSGDGNNYDTIKLIPDAELQYNDGTYNNDQYLIVDPTAPNHIHIRAGGTIDNSNAALFLGGENSNVEIQAGENPPVYVRANNNTWMFDVDGSLSFPDDTGKINPAVSDGGGLQIEADVDFEIKVAQTFDAGTPEETTETAIWSFDSSGGITFPDDTVQTTAYTGSIDIASRIEYTNFETDVEHIAELTDDDFRIRLNTHLLDEEQITWAFGTDGAVTFPAGGTITETVITDNPTIVIEPFGAESPDQGLYIKGGVAPQDPVDYHLHLTTGDLTDTSIIVGTDEHNVRTTVDGGVELNSYNYGTGTQRTLTFSSDGLLAAAPGTPLQILSTGSGGSVGMGWTSGISEESENLALVIANSPGSVGGAVEIVTGPSDAANAWVFDSSGALTVPGDIQSENDISIRINLSDSTQRVWRFGEDGDLSLPAGGIIRETIVTDNPTIELEPANADAASQKLIIKGGQAEEYHLHLTTGDLDETAIFLGTDDHHVKVGGLTGVSLKAKVGSYVTLVTSDDSENPDRYYLSLEPNGMVNFSGQYFNVVFPPDNSTGRTTDLQGMVAFNSGYFYYCTANYTDGLANIWKRVAWSADTW